MTKIFCGNFDKSFLKSEKMALRKIFRYFLHANFFMVILLISNRTVFLVQFGIILHLWVSQKAEIARAEAARAISAFWKTHSCKLIPNWTGNRMVTYTNRTRQRNIRRPRAGHLRKRFHTKSSSFIYSFWNPARNSWFMIGKTRLIFSFLFFKFQCTITIHGNRQAFENKHGSWKYELKK